MIGPHRVRAYYEVYYFFSNIKNKQVWGGENITTFVYYVNIFKFYFKNVIVCLRMVLGYLFASEIFKNKAIMDKKLPSIFF